ncbi:DUF4349 domain-containing protein [Oscillospiraceae bacterium MB08-C2-2]|nr:DUF4349 domain-containing protein [Oscillospiraceae bacterium MB08-C2-2]
MRKQLALLLAFTAVLFALTGCGSSGYSTSTISQAGSYAVREDMAAPAAESPMVAEATESGVNSPTAAPSGYERKLVRNMNITLETLTYDQGLEDLRALTEQLGGFVQNSRIQGKSLNQSNQPRTAYFSLRIPSGKLDELLNRMGESFNLLDVSESTDDYTDQYFDTESRLRALRLREERLLELLSKTARLEDLFQVEQELSQVRYEIESLTGSQQKIDSMVQLSTVEITLSEVVEYQEQVAPVKTFGQELRQALRSSWNGFVRGCQLFVLTLAAALPYLLVLFAVGLVVFLIAWRSAKKRRSAPPIPPTHTQGFPPEPPVNPEQ